jgi:hypothetical protein
VIVGLEAYLVKKIDLETHLEKKVVLYVKRAMLQLDRRYVFRLPRSVVYLYQLAYRSVDSVQRQVAIENHIDHKKS